MKSDQNIEQLISSDDWKEIKSEIDQALITDLADLSGTNPGLRKFLGQFKNQLIGENEVKADGSTIDVDVDELTRKLHGSYELCKNDFNEKHNDGHKTSFQTFKTLGGQARRGSVAITEVAAGATVGTVLGAAGVGAVVGGGTVGAVGLLLRGIVGTSIFNPKDNPNVVEGVGLGVGGLGVATVVGGAGIAAAPIIKLAVSDSAVKLLAEIGFAVYGIAEEKAMQNGEAAQNTQEAISTMKKYVGVGNKSKHAETGKQRRVQTETTCEPRSLLESEMFTKDELNRTMFNHFDNNQNNRFNNVSFESDGIDNLSISSSINDKELAKTILQYQMVKHFGKLSDDGKDFHFDHNRLTNMNEFQHDLNDAHNHIEDYRVFHEAMNKVREKKTVTPRMQNKIANIIIPALINNEYQSNDLGTKLADKLLEKGNTSMVSREFTVKESELRQIAAKITRGDLQFARDKGYTR